MASHAGQPSISGLHQPSPDDEPVDWSGQDYAGSNYRNGSSPEEKNNLGMGFLKGFSGVQKKMTRDGQPAKRRGPKPDSKPAQTRRQELNRQAQRTHRERKEQYIKALELELSRLREAFINERATAARTLEQHQLMLQQQQRENAALREILAYRGIQYESELENRKMAMTIQPKREANSLSPPQMGVRPAVYHNVMSGPASSYSSMQDQAYTNGTLSMSGHSPANTHHSQHSHQSLSPQIQEFSIKQEHQGISDMPGIFEKEPQLGIDFILQLEHTCRDHEEYLVRRSVNSPDDPEEALFSGHALMASCPPPTHIERVPAQGGGLVPTYDHKVPDTDSMATLHNLLNLSQVIKDSYIEGGQVTPIMALQSLKGHPNYTSLNRDDVLSMIKSIKGSVRCYGFGAVMEDFELRDVLRGIFATKPETYETFGNDYSAEIDEMYS